MIFGDNRNAVIENIKSAVETGEFNRKVELNDPVLTDEQSKAIIEKYLSDRKTFGFRFKSFVARRLANVMTAMINQNTEIITSDCKMDLPEGCIITSNHFSPAENTVIRFYIRKCGKKRLNIVSQVSNLAMTGFFGFLMNYADIIPISDEISYLKKDFPSIIEDLIKAGEPVLIYPEQEMWFNYRKPRPFKRGPYYYAAKLNVPVVSCFVEIVDLPQKDTEEFFKVKYILHVLGSIYPDPNKSVHENSVEMLEKDYQMKKDAYEKVYGRELSYSFENRDIAGWICAETDGGK